MPPELVDSHCHLDFPDFDNEIDEVIDRAHEAGISRMVHVCTRPENEPRARALAEAHAGVFYAFGIHPMQAATTDPISVETIIRLSQHPKFVGIGETGLDYHYNPETAKQQIASLRIHIQAAQETQLPLIIHAREADQDVEQLLTDGMKETPYPCVLHCFSSGRRLAEAAIEMGFYLSMSGIVAFRKSVELREIFARAPIDRILVETDSPFLAPPPFRGKRNEPAHVVHTARKGAEIFGQSEEAFAAITTANFERLFTKAARKGR